MALEWLNDKTYEITPKQAARDIVELLTTIRTRYQHSDPDVVDLLALVDRLREGYEDALEVLDATQRALIEVAHQRNVATDALQKIRLTKTTSGT
jgi:hypothetical protein